MKVNKLKYYLLKYKIQFLLFILLTSFTSVTAVEVKLKDIAKIEGIRENQLVGYGLVVGLPGTGDSRSKVTVESIENYLKKFGLAANISENATRNVASVLLTANIPSYAKTGDRIDVTVSSIGDAKSLEGGVLLQSPMKSANNSVVVVSSGAVSTGAGYLSSGNDSRKRNKNVGIIYKGGIVEKEIQGDFFNKSKFRIVLENQDFTNMHSIITNIKESLNTESTAVSPNQIEVVVPENQSVVQFLSALENLTIENENRAKVVINERTGTIVMGGNVVIDDVAISKNGLNLTVFNTASNTEKQQNIFFLEGGSSVADVVDALNKIGATTKDIISILEGIKKSGAMHAELEIE